MRRKRPVASCVTERPTPEMGFCCRVISTPLCSRLEGAPLSEEAEMGVFDDYLVDPKLSLLDKTRIQAQVLVPVLQALRSELGKEKADAIVKRALRDWSKQLFAAVG